MRIKSISDVVTNSSNEAFILRCSGGGLTSLSIFESYYKNRIKEFLENYYSPKKADIVRIYLAHKGSAESPEHNNEGQTFWREGDVVVQIKESSGLMWDLRDLLEQITDGALRQAGISWTDPIFVEDNYKL